MFLRDVGETISTTGRYDRLVKLTSSITQTAPKRLEIIADGAWLDESVLRLGSAAASGTASPVVVREWADGRIVRELDAASGSIRGSWQKHEPEALISVHLQEVDVRSGVLTEQTLRRTSAKLGSYAMSAAAVERVGQIDLMDISKHPEQYNAGTKVVRDVKELYGKNRDMDRLQSKALAEINLRLSYGISCAVMVLLGAALGLLKRGGQVLAAFAISGVPLLAMAGVLAMGREFIRSKSIANELGVGVIWGGIAILTCVTGTIYLRTLRR